MSLSISDFQRISNGFHNAGDITLTGKGKLDMVNNHVGILKGLNTKTISAAKTLEVKNSFVQALKNAGVDETALSKVREELGLPKGGGTKGLDLSSLKPLSRAQTREILDRFEGVINEKAGSTVVSNRWAALKAADDVNYLARFNRAAETNQKSAATRAAAQRKLGMEILDYGADEIPSNIRRSGAYGNLSEANKAKFEKIFTAMLFHGGADVDSIAAEAMKKVLVAEYGSGIQDEAERDLFKGHVLGCPATTDLARIEQDIREAREAAANGLKPEFEGKFTAKDAKPVELHKMQIIENAKHLASSKKTELADDEILLMMDEMAKWEDIRPGQLKNFEAWSKNDIVNYINKSIRGEALGGKKKPFEFDEDGVCTQYGMDSYRSKLTFSVQKDGPDRTGNVKEDNATVFPATGNPDDAGTRCQHFCKVLTNKADRMLISGLMNQASLSTIAALNSGGVLDPDDPSEDPPRVLGLEPEEGKRVPHWSMDNANDMLGIMQPRSNEGWRFELKVDDKNKTATVTITADYEIKPSIHMRDGVLGQADKIGLLVSSYEIQITGLESGSPQVSSFGFRQEIKAQDM